MQVTARSDTDLTPEAIVAKVADASGSKYTGGAPPSATSGPPPPASTKPAFQPTRSSGGAGGFNPLAGSRARQIPTNSTNVDEDGWGEDAPPVTRTQLEKVQPAYQPTKVNLREFGAPPPSTSLSFKDTRENVSSQGDVVRGEYQPVGKVDIAALRRQAQSAEIKNDDRPTAVKGAYEPVGKVDIAAIRARAQKPGESTSPPRNMSPAATGTSTRSSDFGGEQKSLPDRSAPFSTPTAERLTTLPKPKLSNRYGSGTTSFTGTKAPTPGSFGLESKQTQAAPPVGVGRTFADQGGKTPAQLWAEKKARERGLSGASDHPPAPGASPISSQTSGGGEWKSAYQGKSWAPIQTTRTGQSASSLDHQRTGAEDEAQQASTPATGGIGAIRERFKEAPPMGAANLDSNQRAPSPPPLEVSTKPNVSGRGIPIPGLPTRPPQEHEDESPSMPSPPPQPPRSPTPPTPPAFDSGSPINVAMPVGRGKESQVEDAREEQVSPPPAMPARSLAQAVPHEEDLSEEPVGHDLARGAGEAAAATSSAQQAAEHADHGAAAGGTGRRAVALYDYEKAEDNELELKEGEIITNIDFVDPAWWMGENERGESGLYPSNYSELIEDDAAAPEPKAEPSHQSDETPQASQGHTATALYDYEAAEENELSFPEHAKITNVVSDTLDE